MRRTRNQRLRDAEAHYNDNDPKAAAWLRALDGQAGCLKSSARHIDAETKDVP